MTVQIIRKDGHIDLVEDVNRIEVDKESGKRIAIFKGNYTDEFPWSNFTSIVILRNEEVDRVYKASMYIIGKYKKELIEEFKVNVPSKDEFFNHEFFEKTTDKFSDSLYDFYVERQVFNAIGEEMKKKYPDPWYNYGIM